MRHSSHGAVAYMVVEPCSPPCTSRWQICCIHVVPHFGYVQMNTSPSRVGNVVTSCSSSSMRNDGFCGMPRKVANAMLRDGASNAMRCSGLRTYTRFDAPA